MDIGTPVKDIINIGEVDKAAVLAALYNNAQAQGVGRLVADSELMTLGEAAAWLNDRTYFDYLKGRVLKVDLSSNELDARLYDRDNGDGAAYRAIEHLLI